MLPGALASRLPGSGPSLVSGAASRVQLCGAGLDHPFMFEQKAYLIPDGNPALQQWTNQWLNIAQNASRYAHIARKWLG